MKEQEIKSYLENIAQENIIKLFSTVLGAKNIEITSLGKSIKEYVEYGEENFSAAYLCSVKLSLNHLSNYFNKQKLLSQISLREMESFVKKMKESAPLGYRVYIRNLKAFFNKTKDWGYLSENPILKIKLPKKVFRSPKFFTESELQQIVNTINHEIIKEIVVFAFYTGMRLSEIINLKWSSVNLPKKEITVGDENFITKSKRQRIIPYSDIVHRLLERRFPKVINIKHSFVFQKLPGIAFNSDHVSKTFKKAIRKLKMDDQLHFHSLRHSFASTLALKGASLHELRDLLGHSSVQTTEIYSHLNLEKLRSAVEKFDSNITKNCMIKRK